MRIMTNSIMIHFFIFMLASLPATSSTNDTDFHALLAFKEAIDSDPLGALNSWNETTNFCSWEGIVCGKKHSTRVIAIDLLAQGLVGSVSPHIGNLSFLRKIDLQNNSFHGLIPQEIGRLRRLKYIDLGNNSFSGTIPNNLSQCSHLYFIYLGENNLTGTIMPEFGSLYKLKLLSLSHNKLSGKIPPSLGNLTALEKLYLWGSNLQGNIPESLVQLQNLTFLYLSDNNLTGRIPPGVFNISSLSILSVSFNQLVGKIPMEIGLTLPNLKWLGLANNQFSGMLPITVSNASLLEYIDFALNDFIGPALKDFTRLSRLRKLIFAGNHVKDDISFISTLINCTRLVAIDVIANLLTGSLPNNIANLSSQLSYLSLSANQIHGSIPSAIGNLVSISTLGLANNDLSGPIPSEIGQLGSLQRSFIGGNRLTNEIPSTIGNLTLLILLHLDNNNLSGQIPKSLGNCSNMFFLRLDSNNLSSTIPGEIMKSKVLVFLGLQNNRFTGTIPHEIGSLKNLEGLDLSDNKLSGFIPTPLSNCIALEELYLGGNSFDGEIPPSLSALKGLLRLDLSRNNLSGLIPNFLGELDLIYLNLSFNRLRGEVPIHGVFLNGSRISVDGNDNLCGGIADLKFPPCPSTDSKKRKFSSAVLKIAIPVSVAGFICIALSVYYYVFKYRPRLLRRNKFSMPSLEGQFLRLSYEDLKKATSGFSETNLIGAGSSGSVFKGILEDGEKLIAVKVLNLHVKGASKSFMAECNALRRVRHRNLLRILSMCSSKDHQGNDFKALIYEYKANGSLEKWMHPITDRGERTGLTVIQRLNIAIDIASAVEYLHSGTDSTIIHGDLKPSNILLDEDMTAHVGDLGVAKIISAISGEIPRHESSSSIGIKGTTGYIPPEYGMNFLVSTQGDVYSFGILLLEMFTSRRPTDDAFMNDLNLHNYVINALPDNVMKIIDPFIVQIENKVNSKIKDCLVSTLSIGVACSRELPRDRMSMTDAISDLKKTRNNYSANV